MAEIKFIPTQRRKSPLKKEVKDRESIWNREIEFASSFGHKEKQRFFQMLGILLESGLGMAEAFEVLAEQEKKKKVKQMVNSIISNLQSGSSLSDSFSMQGSFFNPFETASIRMGEDTGKLAEVLKSLAELYERRLKLKRKLSQALTYPVAVIGVAGLVMGFMLGFVVPMFKDIFERFDAQLPTITKTILNISEGLTLWGPWIMLSLGLMMVGLFTVRKTDGFRRRRDKLIRSLPLFGKLNHKIQLARFCYILALMLRSKVTLDRALKLASDIIPYYPIQSTMAPIEKSVSEGSTFYEAILEHSAYPLIFRQMAKVGERTAKLDQMIGMLGKNLEEESENELSQLMALMEPILIVVLGIIVAVILVSMYLPMFELSNTIAG